ncbi:MAG: hypothetical protein KME64_17815 [Scytonematopsis contorta HA4267-MV1]|nr:hypothetical protein [Scytonematopsis contorta HA4267-MV1]
MGSYLWAIANAGFLPKNLIPLQVSPWLWEDSKVWKPRQQIMVEVAEFLGCKTDIVYIIRTGFW